MQGQDQLYDEDDILSYSQQLLVDRRFCIFGTKKVHSNQYASKWSTAEGYRQEDCVE
jgi:hypothetical protein